MWNPSEKEAKKAFDYASKSPSNYNKLNEMGKRAFWQYGRDKGIFNINTLGVNAKGEYSKYVTDDMPYASKNPMERATLARQSEQGQFDDSEQVKASKLQDRRLLNESRLEALTPEIKPQPMQLPQTSRQQQPTLKHERAKTYEAKETFDPVKGLGNLALNTLSTVNSVLQTPATMGKYGVEAMEQAKTEGKSPIGGLLKGYGVGLVKALTNQDAVENIEVLEGVAPKTTTALKEKFPNAYNAASVIVNMFGIDDLTAWGLLGDISRARRLNQGINTTADLARMAEGGKVAKLIKENPDIAKVIDDIPYSEMDEYYDYIGYLDEVNRKSPEYIKAEARLNVPKAKEIKTLTKPMPQKPDAYLDDYLDSIGGYEEQWLKQQDKVLEDITVKKDVPKVTIKKERYIPSVNDIIDNKKKPVVKNFKTLGLGGEPYGEGFWKNTYLTGYNYKGTHGDGVIQSVTAPGMDRARKLEGIGREREVLKEQYKRVKNLTSLEYAELAQKGLLKESDYYKYIDNNPKITPETKQNIMKNIKESLLEGRGKKDSEITFREWYYRVHREQYDDPNLFAGIDYRVEYLRAKGKTTDEAIKAIQKSTREDYNKFIKDAKAQEKYMYPKSKYRNTVSSSIETQKGTQPTNNIVPLEPLQPPKLEGKLQPPTIKGQTLKPNKPILSALDAKVNKPYVEPIKPKLELPKLPVEPPKVSGGINTPLIQNKSLTGTIKASDETLPKRKFGDTPKGDILEGMKERGFSRNIRTDEAMPDDIRVNFDDSPLSYNQVGNSETLTKAEKIMEGGQAQAMSQYYDLLSKNKPESVPLAKLIAKNAEAAGDIDTARRVLADAAEKLTEAGQFSQAAKILRESDPETFLMTVDKQLRKLNEQGLKQYGKKWANIDLLPNEITAIQNIPRGNQQAYEEVWEQIANRISKDLPSTKMEKFDAWRRMAMLLNPKTHIRNTVGNVFMVGMRKTSDTLGAGLEKLFRIKERTKSFGWSQNKDIVSKVEETWDTVKKDILGESRWEIDNIKSLGREKNIFKNKTLQGLNEFSLKTLNAEDNIFTQRAFKDALGQFMQANRLAEPTDAALTYAKRRALESTYKQANKLATWINQAKQIPVAGKFVEAAIPFTKTPANIMKTTFEYSPAGLVKLIFSKGKPPAEVIETLAKGLTGTSITGLGFMLASMGAAKTQNSKSNKVSAIDTEMGEQPYSIITPQGSYTFDWAQPLAVPLAMGIAMYESIGNKDELDFDAVMDSIAQGGDSLFNMSMLQNVKQFLGYGSTTENILGLPWNYVQQAWPSLFGQVSKTIDDTKRSTYDPNPQKQTWNRLKSRIPFASKSLEPSLNVWGEEQKQGGIIQQFINPGYAREKSNDPVTIEIDRLHAEHGDNDMLPKMAQNFKIEGKTTKLSPGDMTEFQRKMGQENHTEINRLISSAQYQLLSDKEKMKKIKKIVNDNYEEAKKGIIKKMK